LNQPESHYQILGIKPDASSEEIKRAYRDKCFILHPDRMLGLPASTKKKAEEELIRVNKAFAVLNNAQKKKDYDTVFSASTVKSNRPFTKPPSQQTKTPPPPQPKVKSQPVKRGPARKTIIVETRWMVVIVLSTFFGFLALDRFFLKQYKYAIWKLVTLGGLGMWWLADLIYFGIKSDDFKSVLQNTDQHKNYSRIVAVCTTSWFIVGCLVLVLFFLPRIDIQPSISIQASNSIVGTTFTGKGTGFSRSNWVTIEITSTSSSPDSTIPLLTKSYRADNEGTVAFIFSAESEVISGQYSCKAIDKNTGIFVSTDFEVFPARFRR
jgi:hypothetical protein